MYNVQCSLLVLFLVMDVSRSCICKVVLCTVLYYVWHRPMQLSLEKMSDYR